MGLSRRAAVTPEGVSRGSMGPFETQAADAGHSLLKLSDLGLFEALSKGLDAELRQALKPCA